MAIVNWLVGHQGVVATVVVALIDLAIALSPSLQGNGILHQVWVLAKSRQTK